VVPAAATPWGRPVWVAIYRTHVHHKATKNYQLDLFDPSGRGNHEKTIARLKTGLASREPYPSTTRMTSS